MSPQFIAQRLLLLIALAFFLGLAFEGMYKREDRSVPGGIRTFPILSLAGAALFLIDPVHALPYVAGLLAVGAWIFAVLFPRAEAAPEAALTLMVPACNLVAYALGPVALTQPPWVAVALSVVTVLFMGAREPFHRLAQIIPQEEILTAGQFLVLVGIVLPLVPHERLIEAIPLTPYEVWLAVVAVCATAYASYLVQRYVPFRESILVPAVMGGFYSSTATTVVLAKRTREVKALQAELSSGIVAATAVMYARIGVVVAIFDFRLAVRLAPALAALCLAGAALAYWQWRRRPRLRPAGDVQLVARNPLQLTTAAIFAVALVTISTVSYWARSVFGQIGVFVLAVVVGFADIDPFVVSVAQGGSSGLVGQVAAAAILTAASSNNILKAGYALSFGDRPAALAPAAALAALAVAGFAIAAAYAFGGG